MESYAGNSVTGTLTETADGYLFYSEAHDAGIEIVESCAISGRPTGPATMYCTGSRALNGTTMSNECAYSGEIVAVAGKLRFDGTLDTVGCGPAGMPMALYPQ